MMVNYMNFKYQKCLNVHSTNRSCTLRNTDLSRSKWWSRKNQKEKIWNWSCSSKKRKEEPLMMWSSMNNGLLSPFWMPLTTILNAAKFSAVLMANSWVNTTLWTWQSNVRLDPWNLATKPKLRTWVTTKTLTCFWLATEMVAGNWDTSTIPICTWENNPSTKIMVSPEKLVSIFKIPPSLQSQKTEPWSAIKLIILHSSKAPKATQ